ncbi:MAG: DUF6263 family protein [Verrucomicrobiota bacterium]|nr:DUF6263 family protein [Verrucomicrobiota bacterium]
MKFFALALVPLLLLANCSKNPRTPIVADSKEISSQKPTGEQVDIKVKWVVGKKFFHRNTLDQKSTVHIAGVLTPVVQHLQQEQEYSIEVLKANLNETTIEMELLSQKIKINAGEDKLDFDSKSQNKNDPDNVLAPIIQQIVGSKIQFILGSDGEIKKITGVDDILARVQRILPKEEAQSFQGMFSEDAFAQVIKFYMLHGLPTRPVKRNEQWNAKSSMNLGPLGVMSFDDFYVLDEINFVGADSLFTIKRKGSISGSSSDNQKVVGSGFKIRSGSNVGFLIFHSGWGQIKESTTEMNLEMSMKIPNPNNPTGAMVDVNSDMLQKIKDEIYKAE